MGAPWWKFWNPASGPVGGAVFGLLTVGVFILIGSAPTPDPGCKADPDVLGNQAIFYTDRATGCQYLRARGLGALTPRLGVGGRPRCVKGDAGHEQ